MRPPWAAPPAADPCLSRPYSSSPKQKGGTRIAEAVRDLATHLRMLLSPWEYCPEACWCGCERLHVHGLRERHPRQLVVNGEPVPVVSILVFLCAGCGATWRVLPAFLARCLWRTWDVVEREALAKPRPSAAPAVPRRQPPPASRRRMTDRYFWPRRAWTRRVSLFRSTWIASWPMHGSGQNR